MLLLKNANVLTLNPAQPRAESVLVEGTRIKAVGSMDQMSKLCGKNLEIVDLGGKTVLPGFVDCHIHPILYAFFLMNIDLNNMRAMDELLACIRDKAAETSAGEWLLGLRFNEELLKEERLPTLAMLDEVAPDNPLIILRYCGHLAIANSKALALAGISKDTDDPDGGEIEHDPKGELTGVLRETAISMVTEQMPPPDWERFSEAIMQTFEELAAKGITGIHGIVQTGEMGPSGKLGYLSISAMKAMREQIPLRMYLMIVATEASQIEELQASELHDAGPDSMCKVGAWKMICDGSLGGHSAVMFEPYSDRPEFSGIMVWSEKDLEKMIREGHTHDIQLSMHCIGDKMVKVVFDILERVMAESPRDDHRHRIEHASIMGPDIIKRAKELGAVMSVQPPFISSEASWMGKRIGERTKYIYPFRSFFANDLTVCAGSDGPVEIPDPIHGIYASVNRYGLAAEEAITAEQAVHMYTTHAARAAFEEDIKGTIEPGKVADLVVLSDDPLSIPSEELQNLQVEMTVVGGKIVFSR
jgi:predicted amidohydrolase YtcJ